MSANSSSTSSRPLNKPVAKNYKTKEFAVVEYVLKLFPNMTWTADKRIENGCSKKRPDLLLDLGYQIIIVEIDENQHTNYDCSCENKRLMELSQDVGHRPIIFIRFNPDDYINDKNEKIRSCWNVTKETGIIKIANKNEWIERLESLKSQIEYWSNVENKSDKTVEVVHLYFDREFRGCNGATAKQCVVTDTESGSLAYDSGDFRGR